MVGYDKLVNKNLTRFLTGNNISYFTKAELPIEEFAKFFYLDPGRPPDKPLEFPRLQRDPWLERIRLLVWEDKE